MVHIPRSYGVLALRLIMGLAVLGCHRIGSADSTWTVIASPGTGLGQVYTPLALAMDSVGNLYVADADADSRSRIQKRDAQGIWSVLATSGTAPGQVGVLGGIAVDTVGNLYVGDDFRIQRRDVHGNWSVIAPQGPALGQIGGFLTSLTVDPAGDLYCAEELPGRIQKRDPQGDWFLIAGESGAPDEVTYPGALGTDAAGNLYVADSSPESSYGRILKRDAQGGWSSIALGGGQAGVPADLAIDRAGNLYVKETPICCGLGGGAYQVRKRDAQGNWSVIATAGAELGQISGGGGLTVDEAGNLYVADSGNNRVIKYTPDP